MYFIFTITESWAQKATNTREKRSSAVLTDTPKKDASDEKNHSFKKNIKEVNSKKKKNKQHRKTQLP